MKYHVIDLDDIKLSLGDHYNKHDAPDYKGRCVCYEMVPQDVNECPYCGIPIIWKGSRVWKQKFGSPNVAIRQLNIVPVDDDDEAGKMLMGLARLNGFANESEKQLWDRSRRRLSVSRLKSIIHYCRTARGKPISGRGLISYALNAASKAAREKPPEKPVSAPRTQPTEPPAVPELSDDDEIIITGLDER